MVTGGGVPVHGYMNYRRVGRGGSLVHIMGATRNSVVLSSANGGGNEKTCVYGDLRYFGGTGGAGTLRQSLNIDMSRRMCRRLRGRVGRVSE